MGQGLSIYDSPSTDLKPGTYRIVNVCTKTVIEAPDKDRRKVVCWAHLAPNDKHQMWFVQRAGRGYQFKNCHFGSYFGAPNTEISTLVCASEFPMTWALHPIQGHDTFLLQVPGNDRILSLNSANKENGAQMSLQVAEDGPHHRRWRFEHISDDCDAFDVEGLKQELQSQKEEIQRLRRLVMEFIMIEMLAEMYESEYEQHTAIQSTMGHNLSLHDSPSTNIKPETYRIVNVEDEPAIEAVNYDWRKVPGMALSTPPGRHQMAQIYESALLVVSHKPRRLAKENPEIFRQAAD
ncbi:hypothetical protein BDV93DRAFT_549631 [Ceratobasidium sp. AG-I]|nr:hypothetical protein BDV93DRAFT_549631 [Ceratobasidium sp. AG-I]